MKKLFISVWALAALASCSKEENMGSGTGDVRVAIVPSAGIEHNVISRAAVEGTSFAEGNDVFRLSAFEAATEPTDNWTANGAQAFENMQVNCAANGSLSLATPKYYPPTGTNAPKLWFYAYAPSENGSYTNGNGTAKPSVAYTITGQEDIMAGKVTNTNGFGGVANGETQTHPAFEFSHLLKKITFKVKAGATFDAGSNTAVSQIVVKNVKTSASLNVVNGTLEFSGDADQSLTLSGNSTTITAAGASVPGCLMFEPGTSFTVSVTAGGVTYADATVTLTGTDAGKAGVSHEVTLTFHRSGIVPTATITDWVKGDDAGVDIQ